MTLIKGVWSNAQERKLLDQMTKEKSARLVPLLDPAVHLEMWRRGKLDDWVPRQETQDLDNSMIPPHLLSTTSDDSGVDNEFLDQWNLIQENQ